MLQFPDGLSAEGFLDRHWQKSELFMPQSLPRGLPALSPDELAWLAMQTDVESRIIFSDRANDVMSYRVEHGPFEEQALSELPAKDWTLLVQDVEKHLPDFRSFIDAASFVPDWRIDDLMVSFAVPGGSVGPHRDNYDVFLCQGVGQREWRIASPDSELKAIQFGELSLVEAFADDSPIEAKQGDVLYLPPGIAHWGVAIEPCMTYSIGMRAPTLRDFSAGLARLHVAGIDQRAIEDVFYGDADLAVGEAEPGLISARALERARETFATSTELSGDDLALAFGSVVTDLKAWLAPDLPNELEIDAYLSSASGQIAVHGMARLAYCSTGGQNLIFVNGHTKSVSHDELADFRNICSCRTALVNNGNLFRWLLVHGTFDLPLDGHAT